jgi:hypothetical protein
MALPRLFRATIVLFVFVFTTDALKMSQQVYEAYGDAGRDRFYETPLRPKIKKILK